jgi:replicative DNA helicase
MTETTQSRSLPHALDAEREVLGCVLLDPRLMDDAASAGLRAEDFFAQPHLLVFQGMQRVLARHDSLDLVTLAQDLKDTGNFDSVGGAELLSALLDRAGTTSNLLQYVQIVRDKAVARGLIEAGRAIEIDAMEPVESVAELADRAEQRVLGVLEQRESMAIRPLGEIVLDALGLVEKIYNSRADGALTGVGTGFIDLNKMTHGLQKGDLVIIAARPSMGKTAFVLNLAANAARAHGAKVALFSLEMPSDQLALRMLASEARISLSGIRSGQLFEEDWPRLMDSAEKLRETTIWLDDSPGVTPSLIRAKCRRLKRRSGLDLVVIDYLQLMSLGQRGRSREQEISEISRSLKGLAKDLRVPVVALSQLNRSLEQRPNKRPLLSDLRESGAIEQDADLILFIYREEVYNKDIAEDQKHLAEVIIGKHRNGPTGTIKLYFSREHTRFDNLAAH